MFFLNYKALWATLTLIGFLGVYFFKRRSKDVKVSSLMFFSALKTPAEGGQKLTTLQTPLILFLELLIVTLLILSAAAPVMLDNNSKIPLAVILDDSYSMTATAKEDSKNARHRGLEFLKNNILNKQYYRINLIKGGSYPELIGRHDMTGAEAGVYLDNWRCTSKSADLVSAVRFVKEAFDKHIQVLVITDTPAETDSDTQMAKLNWLAFGKPVNNLAITGANRYSLGKTDRCFFEYTNFSDTPVNLHAIVKSPESNKVYDELKTQIQPMSVRRSIINFPEQNSEICAEIFADDFLADNKLCLPSIKREKVKVRIKTNSKYLDSLLKKTVEALGTGVLVEKDENILITDTQEIIPANTWQMVIHKATDSVMLSGTVAVEREHPLCLGLPPVRALWAVDKNFVSDGLPVLSSDDFALLAVSGEVEKNKVVVFNMDYEYSSLHTTGFWPVLFWNYLNWYQDVFYPVNRELAISREESSFLKLKSNDLPENILPESTMKNFISVRWWFVVTALILIALHQWLVTIRRPGIVY